MNRDRKNGLAKSFGVIMIVAGGLGLVGWLLLMLLGYLLSGGTADGAGRMAFEYLLPIAAGFVDSILELITGIMAIAANIGAKKKPRIIFAAVTALLYLPGIILLARLWWYFAAIPVFLLGFAPPAIYLFTSLIKKQNTLG